VEHHSQEFCTLFNILTEGKLSKRAGEYVHNWGLILDQQSRAYEAEKKGPSMKRERDDDEGGSKKKARTTHAKQGLEAISTNDLRAAIASGTLGKFTVAELKEFVQSKGLNPGGKKADLVERIEQWVENA
jgi:ATP-dependent DNA helicase 2 subunit 1